MTVKKSDYKRTLEDLPVGIFSSSLDKTEKIVFANQFISNITGFTPKQLTAMSVNKLFVDKAKHAQFKKKLISEGFVQSFQARLKTKSKSITWASLSATLHEGKGKAKAYDCTVQDITDQKHFEKQLVESKELFQTVFNKTAAAITVTDKNEKIVAWNPFTETMLGLKKEELFNKPVKDLYPSKEWRRIRSFRIRKKGMLSDIETQVFKSDGSILDVNVSISVIKDSEGEIVGSIGIIRDITNQKAAQYKLIESENKLRVILDNSPAAITLIDDQERIMGWNIFAESLLGMTKKDLHLRPVSELYPEEEWKKIRSENIRKKGSKHHLETKIIRKDKKIIEVDLSINVVKDEKGKIISSIGIMQDITEQKKLQEILLQAKNSAEEANESKSLFLANMSHEVRTPMNTIMGMIDLTLDTELNNEQKDNLSVAKDAAYNLLGLLNDILDLSRVEAGKISLENIEFHLPNVVRSVIKGLNVLAKDKALDLEFEIDSKVPEVVLGDPIRIRQILINLINNAIKFTDKGKVVTRILLDPKKKELVRFEVEDQGIGIPKNRLKSVFEVFTQADISTTRKFGGTGLGLAICTKLTGMMGGKIWAESDEGKGSTFIFTAKLKKVNPAELEGKSIFGLEKQFSKEDDENQALKDVRVLLAEDNLVNQKITMRMLEKVGCIVDVVDNGQSVVDEYQQKEFDVILMDSQMPIMDGLEATKKIREIEGGVKNRIPIIALTAKAMDEDRKKCFEVGMDGYVTKPIDRKALFGEISNQVKKG